MIKPSKKILLLTDIPPTTQTSGGLVLDQLCRFLPKDSICCFVLSDINANYRVSKDLNWIAIKYFPRWNQQIHRGFPRLLKYFPKFFDSIYIALLIPFLNRFAKKNNAEVLWCILQGQTQIRLARKAAKRLALPFLTEVWDPPDWWLRENSLPEYYKKEVLNEFGEALKNSAGCGTASISMAKEYNQLYGTRTIPFLPSLPLNAALPPASLGGDKSEIIISLAGQIYAITEWKALINALQSLNWSLNGKKIILKAYGNHDKGVIGDLPNIEIHGWRDQKNTIKALAEADILYVPYWFDKTFEHEARLSFPSKLISYLASGRFILFHGPAYASPAVFINTYKAGVCCHSLKKEDIQQTIQTIINNHELYKRCTNNGRKAFDKLFTFANLEKSFSNFLNF